MEHIEDEKIWTGLKQHEERVLTTLFDMYYEKLYLFAEKFIYDSDKSHDIVQDIFVRLWENAGKLDIKSSVKSYLFSSTKNGCLNYLRDLEIEDRNNRKYAEAYIESYNIDMVEEEEILDKIRQIMDELPDKCREVCQLRFIDGYKYAEIAERLNINENTVKVQLHRGVKRIKEALSEHDNLIVWLTLMKLFGGRLF